MINNKKTTSVALSILIHSLLAFAVIRAGLHYALPETEVVSGESVSFETVGKSGAEPAPPAPPSKPSALSKSGELTVKEKKSAPKAKSKAVVAKVERSEEPEPKLIPVKDFEYVVPEEKKPEEKTPEPVVAALPEEKESEKVAEKAAEESNPSPQEVSKEEMVAAAAPSEKAEGDAAVQNPETGPPEGSPGSQTNPIDAERLKEAYGNRPPSYPYLSNLKREQGTVTLLAYIRKDGHVDLPIIQKSSGYPRLDQAAITTYVKWKYKPGTTGYALKSFKFRIKQ